MDCRLVEVTGGEPLANRTRLRCCVRLCEDGFKVLLETSGAIDTSMVPPSVHIILDVKCPGSGMSERMHWPNVERLRPKDEAKFVIGIGVITNGLKPSWIALIWPIAVRSSLARYSVRWIHDSWLNGSWQIDSRFASSYKSTSTSGRRICGGCEESHRRSGSEKS